MSNIGQYASTAKSIHRLQRSIKTSSSVLRQKIRSNPYTEEKPMKLTFKQKLRKWLMDDTDELEYGNAISVDSDGPNIQSQGFRLNIYGAAGGTIIETTKYDRQKDDHRHSLHVVTDDKDLGEELAKIITMESLR
jgi:hypothetical protein